MRVFWRLAALGCAFLACACLPVTAKNPVGSTAGFRPDSELLGVWRGKVKDDPAYIAFVNDPRNGMSAVLVSPPRAGDGGDWEVYEVKAAVLGGHRFLSVRSTFENGHVANEWPAGVTAPVLYRVTRRTLALYLLDDAATAAAIRAGEIHGTVDPDMIDSHGKITVRGDVHINEDAAAFDAFMQSPRGLALFKTPLMVLSRLD
jgi:hypothetical protein